MKVLLIILGLAVAVQCDPAHHTKHSKHTRNEENDGVTGPQGGYGEGPGSSGPEEPSQNPPQGWPNPQSVNDFNIPDVFTGDAAGFSSDSNPTEPHADTGKHHSKNHHRNHRN